MPAKRQWLWQVVAGALAVALAISMWALWRMAKPSEQPLVRLDVDLGPDVSLGSPIGPDVIISPDGMRLVFVSKSRLFTRRLDQPRADELAGTDGAYAPFFSPDGQWIAFGAGNKLKKISVEGGAVTTLCDAGSLRGGSWGEDGNIIATLTGTSGGFLSRIPEIGGTPTPVTDLAPGEATHRWPQILPGGKAVLFTAHTMTTGYDNASIEVISLKDRHRKMLWRGGTFGRYLPSGHLVYINKGTLYAVPFDPDKLEVHGSPSPVLEEVASGGGGSALFDFSPSGTLVYRSGRSEGGRLTLQWLDSAGKTQPLPAKPNLYSEPRISPDGKLLALTIGTTSGSDIWTYDWQRDAPAHLTFGGAEFSMPVWSRPDSRYVVFSANPGGIFWTRADGAGKQQRLIESKNRQVPYSFSPDGKRLAFFESASGSLFNLWTVPLENEGGQLRAAGKPESFH